MHHKLKPAERRRCKGLLAGSCALFAATTLAASDLPTAKLGDPDTMQPLTADVVKTCKRMVKNTTGDEVKEMLLRNGEYMLPVTPKFIAIEFKHKENVLYCYSAKAADYKGFKPVKLIYFTNYKPYGAYDPVKGLQVLF
ncbi:MAG: hypothetical protein AB1409_08335 [Pseudomonadota bacterium]